MLAKQLEENSWSCPDCKNINNVSREDCGVCGKEISDSVKDEMNGAAGTQRPEISYAQLKNQNFTANEDDNKDQIQKYITSAHEQKKLQENVRETQIEAEQVYQMELQEERDARDNQRFNRFNNNRGFRGNSRGGYDRGGRGGGFDRGRGGFNGGGRGGYDRGGRGGGFDRSQSRGRGGFDRGSGGRGGFDRGAPRGRGGFNNQSNNFSRDNFEHNNSFDGNNQQNGGNNYRNNQDGFNNNGPRPDNNFRNDRSRSREGEFMNGMGNF